MITSREPSERAQVIHIEIDIDARRVRCCHDTPASIDAWCTVMALDATGPAPPIGA